MQTFVTIFPYLKNAHLIKDVGLIPWYLQHLTLYKTRIVAYQTNEVFTHLQQETKGLEIEQIPLVVPHKKIWQSGMADYLRRNAAKINILNLYHLTIESFIYAIIYKQNNPAGTIYLKADVYNTHLHTPKYSDNPVKNWYYKKIARKALGLIDFISVENTPAVSLVRKNYPHFKGKVFYLPNGVNNIFIDKHLTTIPFYEKKNQIIISGRIGAPEKNHEILLQVIPKLHLNDWQFVFAGTIDSAFSQKVKTFFAEYPQLKKQVLFTGEIQNRKILYNLYNESKIMCLTSEHESFGIAMVEALYFGNYLIGTGGMYAFDDLTAHGKFGEKLPFNDEESLRKTLQNLIDNPQKLKDTSVEAKNFTRQYFAWSEIIGNLYRTLHNG